MSKHLRVNLAEFREFLGCPHAYFLSRARKMSAANRFSIYSNACKRVLQAYFLEKANNFYPFDELQFLMLQFNSALFSRHMMKLDDSERDYMKGMFALFANVVIEFCKGKRVTYPVEPIQYNLQWSDGCELTIYCEPLAAVGGSLTGGSLTGADYILVDPTNWQWNRRNDSNGIFPGFFKTISKSNNVIDHTKNNLYVFDSHKSAIQTIKLKGKKLDNWEDWIRKAGRSLIDGLAYPMHHGLMCQKCVHKKICSYFGN